MKGVSFDLIVSLLENLKRNGNGQTARCPSHDDGKNSLSVSKTSDGKPLLYCHAGCSFQDVIAALNLPQNSSGNNPQRKIEEIYEYTNETGDLIFQTIRYAPKDFHQRRPDGNGGWIWNLKDTPLFLYRLPEVIASPVVYIVEGEKDVETLRAFDLPATCCPMGAGKWRECYNECLRDKIVVILPDNDKPGRDHAEKIARSLYGIARGVTIVHLPNLPEKADVTDYFQNGGTVDELTDLVGNAIEWKPEVVTGSKSAFNFTSLNNLLNEPEEETPFVWDKTLPFGGFSICSAKPKVGKSTKARNLAVAVSKGEPFLGRETVKGKVLYLCLEEKRAEIAKHFRAMGADGENILIYTGSAPENAIEELAIAIAEFEPILVIVDPLSRILRVRDFNDYGGMARGLEPLIDLARKMGCHILALHHDSKMDRGGGDALLGSTALFGGVDCHIQMRKREQSRTISTTQRYGEDLPETVVELDKETGIISEHGSLQDHVMKKVKAEVLNAVSATEEKTELAIKEIIEGFPQGVISKAIRELLEARTIRRTGEGKKGNPFLYSKTEEV